MNWMKWGKNKDIPCKTQYYNLIEISKLILVYSNDLDIRIRAEMSMSTSHVTREFTALQKGVDNIIL